MGNDGISYVEFSYQLFQAYDFLHLSRNKRCSLQIGGSDQWGNIVAGIDLIHSGSLIPPSSEDVNTRETPAFGLTIPLVTTATGEKFGKSEGNAIWLDEKLLSVFDFYQVRLFLTLVLP